VPYDLHVSSSSLHVSSSSHRSVQSFSRAFILLLTDTYDLCEEEDTGSEEEDTSRALSVQSFSRASEVASVL
jgi:hypothetical protein